MEEVREIAVMGIQSVGGKLTDRECQECQTTFFNEASMMRHKKTVHDKVKSHKCDICEKCYSHLNSLKDHLLTHSLHQPVSCWCGKSVSNAQSLKFHQNTKHKGKAKARGKCDLCEKMFYRKSAVKRHVFNVHTANRTCKQCKKAFSNSADLRWHLMKEHEDTEITKQHIARWDRALGICHEGEINKDEPNHCDQCGEVFKSTGELKKHFTEEHSKTNISDAEIGNWNKTTDVSQVVGGNTTYGECTGVVLLLDNVNMADGFKDTTSVLETLDKDQNQREDIDLSPKEPGTTHGNTFGSEESQPLVKDMGDENVYVKDEDVKYFENGDFKLNFAEANENGSFPCDECLLVLNDKNEQKEHKLGEHEGLRYECNKCDQLFMSQSEMNVHKTSCKSSHKKVESSLPAFNCRKCSFRASRADRLNDHMLSEHDGKRHCCNDCGETFAQIRNLQAHIRKDHEDEAILCDKCDYRTTRKDSLRMHIQSKHEGIKYKCNQCTLSFNRQKSLDRHIISRHKRLKCEFCNYSSNHAYKIESHNHAHHKDKQLNKAETRCFCDHCDSSYSIKTDLQEHIRINHLNVLFQCDQCHKLYSGKKELIRHEQVKHKGLKFHCDECDLTYSDKTNLQEHINIKHKGIIFECEQCQKSYNSNRDLKRHVKSKHEGLAYYCDTCGHESPSPRDLYRHRKTKHEADKATFLCDQCEYVAGYRSVLNTHKQSKHDGVKLNCNVCSYRANSDVSLRIHLKSKHTF